MSVKPEIEGSEAIIIWDESEQFSVMNLLPEAVREKCKARRGEDPVLFEMSESELYKEMRRNKHTPSVSDNRIRLKFWMEYDECITNYNRAMNLKRIAAGTTSYEYFIIHFLKNCYRVAWMLMPPANYKSRMVEALDFGLDQMREILNLPLLDDDGKLDHKLAAMKITIFKMLDDRSNGVAIQRLESKMLQINANIAPVEMKRVRELAESMSVDEMRKLHSDRAKNLRVDVRSKPELFNTGAAKSVAENVAFVENKLGVNLGNSTAKKKKDDVEVVVEEVVVEEVVVEEEESDNGI